MTSHTTESRDRMGSDVVNDVSGSGVFPSGSDYKEDGVSSKNENRNTNYTRMLCTIFPTTTNRIARVRRKNWHEITRGSKRGNLNMSLSYPPPFSSLFQPGILI
jgi:hypothetical protein